MARRGLGPAAVLEVAARVADADGLDAVTVARVAGELGVRGPSLYNHVTGRGGLLRGIALASVRESTERMRAAAVGRSGRDALAGAARAYRTFAREHPGRYDAMQRAPAGDDEALDAAGEEAIGVLAGILRSWALEGDDAVHAIRGLRSALHGFVDLERIGGFGLPVPLDASFERLVEDLAAALDARAGTGQASTTSTP